MCWQASSAAGSQLFVTVASLLLLQCVSNGAAIKCFVCDSSINPGCADLKTNTSIVAEECTLDKIRSIDTWLFELNKFAYFDTGGSRSPLMHCQKVVAKDPNTNQVVTARFCQLDTADSDACSILRTKLKVIAEDANRLNNYNSNGGRRGKYAENGSGTGAGASGGGASENGGKGGKPSEEDKVECVICTSDQCNGADRRAVSGSAALLSTLAVLAVLQSSMLHQQSRHHSSNAW